MHVSFIPDLHNSLSESSQYPLRYCQSKGWFFLLCTEGELEENVSKEAFLLNITYYIANIIK
ncbi:hypothetical protein QFZ25_003609 [Bacillus atrophaeus]|nr:hypothetical protein [Bacillus atrophaeus]